MEKDLKFSSAVCTSRVQSERLLALGLKKETADMCHRTNGMGIYFITALNPLDNPNDIPAWSLHRMMSMLTAKRKCLLIRVEADLYDVLINRIEHEIKEGYFNKEYLDYIRGEEE